jgi:hypothetical protein
MDASSRPIYGSMMFQSIGGPEGYEVRSPPSSALS